MSISTAPVSPKRVRPYEDELDANGLLSYRYRGTDPRHWDNVALRLAMQRQVPLIYMYGIVKGQYLPIWPVYVVGDDPAQLSFKVAVDDRQFADRPSMGVSDVGDDARRGYVTTVTMRRVHQASFRQRVLRAYQQQCAVCRLRHTELLEAAHILPDSNPRGEPIVPNGLALCKLHHAAFDRHLMGIRPDLVVEIRRDILEETDGPMLRYGLQQMDGSLLVVPRAASQKPRAAFLEERYELFKKAG